MGGLTAAVLIESIRLPPEPQRATAIAGTKHALPSGEMPGPVPATERRRRPC